MRNRKFMLFLTMIIAIFVLAACGGGNKNDNKTNNAGSSNGGNNGEEVSITWWAFPNFQAKDGELGKYEKEIIEAFNEKHPEIEVKLEMVSFEGGSEKLNTAISTNTAPDVLYDAPGRIIDYAKKDLLADLNDMFPDEVTDDIEDAIMKQSM